MWRRCSLVLALVACKAEPPVDTDPVVDSDTDVDPQDTGPFVPTLPPPDPDPDACDSFAIEAPAETGPLTTVFLGATGGIGPYTWAIETNSSGGAINGGSGEWFTGPTPSTDTVSVYDAGCDATDSADVVIFPAIRAEPPTAVVPPGTVFDVSANNGSGAFSCSSGTLTGGATLNGCTFTAGAVGESTVIVTDATTLQTDVAVITVADDVELLSEAVLLIPVGFAFTPDFTGGSGHLAIPATAGLTVVDDQLVASTGGTWTLVVSDPTTGIEQSVTIVAADPLTVDGSLISRDGDFLDQGQIRTADFDGDGFSELVVSTVDRAAHARAGGAVFVYPGSASGPTAPPALVLGSDQPDARAGTGLAIGDFDGDGEPELAIGEYLWDRGARASVGRVRVYAGLAGGLVSDTDTVDLEGFDSSDQLGYSVAACDVDGDGFDDLIAGGVGLDDDSVSPTVSNTGGIQVYFGGPDGLPTVPDRVWYAQRPSAGGTSWSDGRNAEAGSTLATGDLDGDGLCDVAIGGRFGDAVSDTSSRGGVWVLRDEELLAAPGPAYRVFGHSGGDAIELGTRVAFTSVGGSDHDALIVTARYASNTAGDSRAGAVFAYRSQSLAGPATQLIEAVSAADWAFEGATSNDYIGQSVAVAPDGTLRIGGPRATPLAGGGEKGGVFAATVDFSATAPASAANATVTDGVASGSYFGRSVGIVAESGLVVARAPRESHDLAVPPGLRDGALYRFDPLPVEIDMPTGPNGGSVGTSVAWFDVDGGGADVVAGAPTIGLDPVGPDSGALASWSGGTGAGAVRAVLVEQDTDEFLGQALRNVGDLDGDGRDDLAVVAPGRSYSGPLPAPFSTGACPADSRSRAGAVFVWLGTTSGIGPQPDFAFFGRDANDRLASVSSAFDFDGDGQQGLAIGSPVAEAVWVYDGPWTRVPGQIVERCDPETTLTGPPGGDFGVAVQGVPSVDGDACDELVVSAPQDELAGSRYGAVRLFRGCAAGASWKTWTADGSFQRIGGGGLAVGDLTGNGTADIAVGSVTLDDGLSDVGATWFIGESQIGAGSVVWDNSGGTDFSGLSSEVSAVSPHRLTGSTEDERLGAELAVAGSGANAVLLVGRPGAFDRAGAVDGWSVSAAGFGRRVLQIGAEGRYAELGRTLSGTAAGTILVGAPTSDVATVDGGAVYRFVLP